MPEVCRLHLPATLEVAMIDWSMDDTTGTFCRQNELPELVLHDRSAISTGFVDETFNKPNLSHLLRPSRQVRAAPRSRFVTLRPA